MANSLLSGGLLGMGGFGGMNAQPTSLLGEFYDPKMARNAQIKNMLLGMGVGLMSEKGLGRGAELALTMGNQAQDDYRQMAFDQYRMKTAQDERADARDWRQKEWDYRTTQDKEAADRQAKSDAWATTFNQAKLDELQREEDMRAGQQNAVEGFATDFRSQGGDLFDPGMQSWLRGQGIAGVDPTDTQRYNKMQPYMAAQDYGGAFQQMTAEAAKPEQFTLGEGQIRYDEYGNPVAAGPSAGAKPPQIETFFDAETGQQYKAQWDVETQQWVPVGGKKASSGGITITNPDGTVTQIGGGQKSTEGDRRAAALYAQIAEQEPALMAGFDALAAPGNYVGANVPGGAAIMTPQAQVAADAITNVIANWLYLTSGATATTQEIERQTAMVTPGPFDSRERVAAKKARLKTILSTMRSRAGVQETPDATVDELLELYGGGE